VAFKDARKQRGLYLVEVVKRERVSPHIVRVTVTGEDLGKLPRRGYDHWFRLFLPAPGGQADFSRLSDRFATADYLRLLTGPRATRPVFRNYTVRQHRPEEAEIDIDFVVHGRTGVAGPWAERAEPGMPAAILDQGRGFDPLPDADFHILVGDESALPAVLGILRDLPDTSRGVAIIEVPDAVDSQPATVPPGVELRWLARTNSADRPGAAALAELREVEIEAPATASCYLAGEQTLAAAGRRHLISVGVPKPRIAFHGYWRLAKAAA
jgi:NADPH-dependent ferric siderophore reductase